jgi:hypothetical protein
MVVGTVAARVSEGVATVSSSCLLLMQHPDVGGGGVRYVSLFSAARLGVKR